VALAKAVREEEGGDEPAKGKKDDGSEQITLDMGGK